MRKRLIELLLVAGAAAALYSALPPRSEVLPATAGPQPVRGAIHVHTRRSDGTGTIEDVAAAASRAGLQFVVITDHGDAFREPERPVYRSNVLCIDAVEISTRAGHLIALGLPKAPYPLGGEARDVIEDVERLGGMAIAAHPGSPKPDLQWTDWDVPIDGLEWLNGDSEWRDETAPALARALLTYPFRSSETLGALLDRPDGVLSKWDTLTRRRRIVAVAGADAHARIGLRGSESYDQAVNLNLPGYEQLFRTFSIVLPQARMKNDAAADAKTVIDEIRRGHVYSSMDAIARGGTMTFTATSGSVTVPAGESLMPSGNVSLDVETSVVEGSTLTLIRDGQRIASAQGARLQHNASEPGVYRIEVALDKAPGRPPVPWLVSNPIYVGGPAPQTVPAPGAPAARDTVSLYSDGELRGWTVETSADSKGAVEAAKAVGGSQIRFRYALGGVEGSSGYAALVMPAGELQRFDRLMFSIRADKPTRLSIQARLPAASGGHRWQKSVYVDETARPVTIFFDELAPVGAAALLHPPLPEVQAWLFVLDTVNTRLGSNGQVWIDDVKYGR